MGVSNKTGGSVMKKVIATILLVLMFVMVMVLDRGINGLVSFWNAPSLIFLLVVDGAVLVLSDCVADFMRGLKIAAGNTEFTMKEMKSSYIAYKLLVKVTFISSIVGSLVSFVNMTPFIHLESNDNVNYFFAALGIAIITIVYGLIINILVLSVEAKINKEIIYREN